MKKNTLIQTGAVVTTVAVAVAALFTIVSSRETRAQAGSSPQAVPVQVATVVQSDVRAWDEFSGRLEAVERVDVRSRVAGTVHAVHFREGTLVKRGDLLITIDPAPYQAEVDRAEAQVASAQARVTYTKSEAERAQRLLEERAIAGREHEERLNAHREAEANLRAAQAALQSARLNLGYTRVAAPVSGRVGKLEITVGNLVAAGPGAPVLTTLVSVDPIYASFEADERVLAKALQGLKTEGPGELAKIPVEMGTAATADTPYKGKLQLVDNQVDAKSGTVRVRAIFDNRDGSLIPGQFAKLRMAPARAFPAVLITERAVGTDQSKRYVMVVGQDNKADYREVKLGPSVDGLRVVTEGLKADEKIVVNGLQRVRPGTLVAPEPVVMAKAS
jgi:multidrug efflux system membrane fusion protein